MSSSIDGLFCNFTLRHFFIKSAAKGDIYLRIIDSHKSIQIKFCFGLSVGVSASISLFTFYKILLESFIRL